MPALQDPPHAVESITVLNALLALKKGDQIVTAGGVVGEVLHIKEGQKDGTTTPGMGDHITIRSGESRLVVTRGRIAVVGAEDTGTP